MSHRHSHPDRIKSRESHPRNAPPPHQIRDDALVNKQPSRKLARSWKKIPKGVVGLGGVWYSGWHAWFNSSAAPATTKKTNERDRCGASVVFDKWHITCQLADGFFVFSSCGALSTLTQQSQKCAIFTGTSELWRTTVRRDHELFEQNDPTRPEQWKDSKIGI